jgi:hypothetical protein
MSGVSKTMIGKKIAGALTALGIVLAPVALYADASAPWVNKPRVMKKKAVKAVRKRKAAVRSVRRAPARRVARAMPRPQPEPAVVEMPAPMPEPVYTPPPVPEAPPVAVSVPEPVAPVSVPSAPTPSVATAPASSGGGFPILAVVGALAAIGGIVAVASGGSDSP